eukprot:6471038-Amphidinium_carterae.1
MRDTLRSGQFPMAPVPMQRSHRTVHVEHNPTRVNVMTHGKKANTWRAARGMNALGGAMSRGDTHTKDMGRGDMGFTGDKAP